MLFPAIVVVSADATVAVAAQLLHAYSDRADVALRMPLGPKTFWYVLTVGDLRSQIQGAKPETMLQDLLNFERLKPAETWQLREGESPHGTAPTLILDGDRLVGLTEPSRSAGTTRQDPEQDDSEWGGRSDIAFESAGPARSVKTLFKLIPVFYGTDRLPVNGARSKPFYDARRGVGLSFGIAQVAIPARHKKGQLERPVWWKLEWREDPVKHVVVSGVEALSRPVFLERVKSAGKLDNGNDALIFVHGYNVTFEEAARRTAQLADDLDFRGVALMYSWPSLGTFLGYITDETNVRWTEPHFEEFLRLALTEIGARAVHVIAHSMGNRTLIESLESFDVAALPPGSADLSQVIFAAPDFDADTFRDLADKFRARAKRFTLYASSNDKALKASRELRSDLARAGESGANLVVVRGIDTIDASAVDTSLLGHGYYGERTVLGDIYYLLREGKDPDSRFGLTAKPRKDLRYWELVP